MVETRRSGKGARGKAIARVEFRIQSAVGGYAGLLVPKQQPLSGFFFLEKEGDYHSALLMIGQDGTILYAEVNPDYTRRPEPDDMLPALRQAAASARAA